MGRVEVQLLVTGGSPIKQIKNVGTGDWRQTKQLVPIRESERYSTGRWQSRGRAGVEGETLGCVCGGVGEPVVSNWLQLLG